MTDVCWPLSAGRASAEWVGAEGSWGEAWGGHGHEPHGHALLQKAAPQGRPGSARALAVLSPPPRPTSSALRGPRYGLSARSHCSCHGQASGLARAGARPRARSAPPPPTPCRPSTIFISSMQLPHSVKATEAGWETPLWPSQCKSKDFPEHSDSEKSPASSTPGRPLSDALPNF